MGQNMTHPSRRIMPSGQEHWDLCVHRLRNSPVKWPYLPGRIACCMHEPFASMHATVICSVRTALSLHMSRAPYLPSLVFLAGGPQAGIMQLERQVHGSGVHGVEEELDRGSQDARQMVFGMAPSVVCKRCPHSPQKKAVQVSCSGFMHPSLWP